METVGQSPDLPSQDRAALLEWRHRCVVRFEDVVEECIAVLDAMRGDPDLEDGDPEEDGEEAARCGNVECGQLLAAKSYSVH
jgi:hypothetical protein